MRPRSRDFRLPNNNRHTRRFFGTFLMLLAASCLQGEDLTISNLIFDSDQSTSEGNEVMVEFDAPFFASDGRTRLSGDTFRAQLWTRPTDSTAPKPLTNPVGFKEGAGAGYFSIDEPDILPVDQHGVALPADQVGALRWTNAENPEGFPVQLRIWESPSSSSEAEYGEALLRLELEAHWNPVSERLTWEKELSRTIGLGVEPYPGQNAISRIDSLADITLSRGQEPPVRLVDGNGRLGALEYVGGRVVGSVSGLLWEPPSGLDESEISFASPGIPLPGERVVVSAELAVAGSRDVTERFQWTFYQSTISKGRPVFRRGPLLEHIEMRFAALADANGDGRGDIIGSPRKGGFSVWLQGENRHEFFDSRVTRGKRDSLPIAVRKCADLAWPEVWSVDSNFTAAVYLLNSGTESSPEQTYELEEPPLPAGLDFRSSITKLVSVAIETGCSEGGYLAGLVQTTALDGEQNPIPDKMVQRLAFYELDTELKGGLRRLQALSPKFSVTEDVANDIGNIVSLLWADVDPASLGQELLSLNSGGTIHKWTIHGEEVVGRPDNLNYETLLSGVMGDSVDGAGQMLSVVDLDDDGHLEVVVVNKQGAGHVLRVFENLGNGQWMALEFDGEGYLNLPESESLGAGLFVEDIDGDGIADIWSSGGELGPVIWFGSRNADGGVEFVDLPVVLEPNGIPFRSTEELGAIDVGILELESDAGSSGEVSPDVIVANESGIVIYENLKVERDSGESYKASSYGFPHGSPVDDFEFFVEGGDLRIVGVSGTGMEVYRKPDFGRNLVQVATAAYGGSVVRFADFDRDGTSDVAIGGSRGLKVLAGNGEGGFSFLGESAISVEPQDMVVGDFDLDGDFDLVLGNRSEASTIWFNDGAGALEFGGRLGGQETTRAMALGNIFVDGDPTGSQVLDIWLVGSSISAESSESNAVYEGLAGGQFSEQTKSFDNEIQGNAVALGDLDGDGDDDAWTVPSGVFLNEGGEFTSLSGTALLESGETTAVAIELADFDRDGDLDAFIANHGQPNEVWLNEICVAYLNFTASDGSTWSRSVYCGTIESASSVKGPWNSLGVLKHEETLEIDVSQRHQFFRSVP